MQIDQTIAEYVCSCLGVGHVLEDLDYLPEPGLSEKKVVVVASDVFLAQKRENERALQLREIKGVPLLFGEPRIELQGGKLIIHADIIASAFFLLSRYEEVFRRDVRDQHGRFPGKESLPVRAGFIGRPIVDEYGRLFRKWLRGVGLDASEPERKFKVSLTHDVDVPWRYSNPAKAVIEAAVGRRGKRDGLRALATGLHLRRDPANTFDLMRRMDNEYRESADHDVEIVYFFMAGGSSRFDGHYDVRDPRIRRLIKTLQSDGAVIGLHPSYEAGGNPELIEQEKAILEDVCGFQIKHSRHHYLRMREPEHISFLEEAGIEYDYTLGYADHIGFRCGTCYPFHPWDFNKNRPSKVLCHPLLVMEQTLFQSAYMGLSRDEAIEQCLGLKQAVYEQAGGFSALWHNNAFEPRIRWYHRAIYDNLLNG